MVSVRPSDPETPVTTYIRASVIPQVVQIARPALSGLVATAIVGAVTLVFLSLAVAPPGDSVPALVFGWATSIVMVAVGPIAVVAVVGRSIDRTLTSTGFK